jgi:hypothetical protein
LLKAIDRSHEGDRLFFSAFFHISKNTDFLN